MPATIVPVPPTASLAARSRSRRSASERVGLSPVVPETTMPSEPCSTRCRASAWNASKSIDPSSWNGVTIAVRTLPSIRRLYVPPRSGILTAMARFVLVHGAWHGAWCWREVADGLERRGHVVETPHLPCDEPGLSCRGLCGVRRLAPRGGRRRPLARRADRVARRRRRPRLPRRAAAHGAGPLGDLPLELRRVRARRARTQLLARCRHMRGADVSGLHPGAVGRGVRATPPPVAARSPSPTVSARTTSCWRR